MMISEMKLRALDESEVFPVKKMMAFLAALILVIGCFGGVSAEGHGPSGMGGPGGKNSSHGGPDGGPGGAPGGMSESAVAGTGNSMNAEGQISVTDGTVIAADAWKTYLSEEDGRITVSGLEYASGDYSETVLSVSGSEAILDSAKITLGVDGAVSGSESAGTAACADSGMLTIRDSEIEVDGAGRYTVAATGTATMVVEDSVIRAGGDLGANGNTSAVSEPASNAGLLISGTSRANFSVGQTHTFYYDSLCTAEGWAALSTDSATGSGLEFVGVNTEAVALHGGYGIYADSSCRDYLYGCTLVSAEVGAIISNNGMITVGSSGDANEAVTQDGIGVMSYSSGGTGEDSRTLIVAGRNDFQLHSPDMMSEGNKDYSATLTLAHTDLITDDSINGEGLEFTSGISGETCTIQATEDYTAKYGEAVGAYIAYVKGAAVLAKSTSAEISLTDVSVSSFSGVALMSTMNSDSMSRYLKQDVGKGVNVSIRDSQIEGDFVHDDYQRDMNITLSGSTLKGDVTFSTAEEWNAKWEEYAEDEKAYWVNLEEGTYVTDTHETSLTLTDGSVWEVKESSELTRLVVSKDSKVIGTIGAEKTEELEDGSVVYTNVKVSGT